MSPQPRQQTKKRKTPVKPAGPSTGVITQVASSRWSPYALFLILSLIYFGGFLFSDVAIFGSDNTGGRYFAGGSFKKALDAYHFVNWSRWQGGTPISDSLPGEQFFPTSLLYFFFTGYRALGYRMIILTFCAGAFMYLFLRQIGLNKVASTLSGLGYMFAPTFLSFTYAGHDAKMSVITLSPLLLFFLEKGLATGRFFPLLCFSGVLGIAIFSPHLQLVYFALWGVGLYTLFRVGGIYAHDRNIRVALRRALLALAGLAIGLAIGAMTLIPPYLTTKTVSKRAGGVTSEYAASWSLHPEEIASLVIPEFGNSLDNYWGQNFFKLNSEYFGAIVLVLGILSFSIVRPKSHLWYYLTLFALAILFSLGSHTPVHRLFYTIVPGVKSLRAPGTIAFLFAFSAIVCAGYTLHQITTPANIDHARLKKVILWIGLVSGGLALFIAIAPETFFNIWTGLFYSTISSEKRQVMIANVPNVTKGALLFIVFLVATLSLVYYRVAGRLGNPAFFSIVALLIIFDTWRIDKQFLVYIDPYPLKPSEDLVVQFLKKDPDLFRVLALPDGRNANLPGIDIVNGFYDFTNKRYDEIQKSQHFGTLPVLSLLNTKYVVSKEPLSIPGIEEALKADGTFVYKNSNTLPWFFLVGNYRLVPEGKAIDSLTDPTFDPRTTVLLEENPGILSSNDTSGVGQVEKLDYQEQAGYIKLRVDVKRPALLVVCENYHPKWHASIDGKEVKILRANHVWKAIRVEPGIHTVEFRYHSRLASICRWISLLSTIGTLGVIVVIVGKPYLHKR